MRMVGRISMEILKLGDMQNSPQWKYELPYELRS